MKTRSKFLRALSDGANYEVTFQISDKNAVAELEKLKNEELTVEVKKYAQERSLNANAYSWKLQDEIAKAVNRSIDDVHMEMVLQYGVINTYSMLKESFESAKRMFDYYKILGESEVNGKTFVHVRAGIGTHLYNSTEMARFIDGVVQEAQQLDIDTKTPEEIAEIKSLWGTK